MRAGGRSTRGRRLAAGPRFRHARPDPRRPDGRGEGAAADVSVVVVGLNHRTAPVELLERMTVPPARLAQGARTRSRSASTWPRSSLLSTCNRTEVYAAHDAVPPRRRRRPPVPRRPGGPRPRRARRPPLHVPRRRRGRAPVRRGRRPRLDDHRRGRDPRPGPRGVAGRRARGRGRPVARPRIFRQAVEVGKRARTETGIGRHAVSVPSAAVSVAGGTARFARRAAGARARRRRRRRGDGGRARRVPASARSSSRTARRARAPSARASRVGGRAIPLDDVADALVDIDVLLVVAPAPPTC